MSIPSLLTMTRLLIGISMGPLLLLESIPQNIALGTVLFLLACGTDVLDGRLARQRRTASILGGFLDKLADMLLIHLTLLALTLLHEVPVWLTFPIIIRDTVSNEFKRLAATKNVHIPMSSLEGKLRIGLQYLGLTLMLISLLFPWAFLPPLALLCLTLSLMSGISSLFCLLRQHARLTFGR